MLEEHDKHAKRTESTLRANRISIQYIISRMRWNRPHKNHALTHRSQKAAASTSAKHRRTYIEVPRSCLDTLQPLHENDSYHVKIMLIDFMF